MVGSDVVDPLVVVVVVLVVVVLGFLTLGVLRVLVLVGLLAEHGTHLAVVQEIGDTVGQLTGGQVPGTKVGQISFGAHVMGGGQVLQALHSTTSGHAGHLNMGHFTGLQIGQTF